MMQWKRRQSNFALGLVQLRTPLAVSTSSRGIVECIQQCSRTLGMRCMALDRCQRETTVDSVPKQL